MNSTNSELKELPSFEVLFTDAFSLFKSKVKQYLMLLALQFGISALLGIVFLIFLGILAGGAGILTNLQGDLSSMSPESIVISMMPLIATGGVTILVGLILMVVLSLAFQNAFISLVGGYEKDKKDDLTIHLKRGFQLVLPMLALGIIVSLLSMGGMMLLLIPGILISIFLVFAKLELVLEDRGVMESMKRSAYMVGAHFWGIIGRYLLFVGAVILVSWTLGVFGFASSFNESGYSSMNGLVMLLRFVFNILLGLYSIAYTVTLYKQVKASTPDKKASLTWMWVVGAIGWLLAILVLSSITRFLINNGAEMFRSMSGDDANEMQYVQKEGVALPTQAAAIFATLNSERAALELDELEEDERLCAFARRRADQLMEAGGFDDNRGWYEDIASTEVQRAYLQGYDVISYFSTADNISDASEIIQNWDESGEDASLFSADHTNGCARSNDEVIVLVTAG